MILLEILFCVFEDGKRIIDDLLRKDFYVSLKLRGGAGVLSAKFLLKLLYTVIFSHFISNSKY